MNLNGKVSIVTGAGQGIGKAIAQKLIKSGSIVVLADIAIDKIRVVRDEIKKAGGESMQIQMDVSKWQDAKEMVQKVLERYGKIDILVNNAGVTQRGKNGTRLGILDIGDNDWDYLMRINLKGVFNCSKAVIPIMIKQRNGKIVNMGSNMGLTGGGIAPAHYSVSKAGVICLTKVLARELGQYNINVNAIAPGRTITEMAKSVSSEVNEEIRKNTPIGRFGYPNDIAKAVLFLVSESGNSITGYTMVIDGGRTMH